MPLMQRGMAWLAGKLATSAGVTVLYSRGATALTVPGAVPASALEQSSQPTPGGRAAFDASARDYLIDPAAIASLTEPRRGDLVTEPVGGALCVFVVTEIAGGKCWQWADPERTRMRVHTRAKVN